MQLRVFGMNSKANPGLRVHITKPEVGCVKSIGFFLSLLITSSYN